MKTSLTDITRLLQTYVESYQRTYLNVGQHYYAYASASAYAHSIALLFSESKAVRALVDEAVKKIDNIWLNGVSDDYSRLQHAPDLELPESAPISLVQVDWTEEQQTELTHDPAPVSFDTSLHQADCLCVQCCNQTSLWTDSVATVHIQGNDFEEVLTESDFEPDTKPIQKSPAVLFVPHLWSMWRRPKKSRVSRLPQEYDYTGCFRYSANRGSGKRRVA
ncbi:hypothetical protein [Methylomonas sp. TEB]|uniref:hypothetical protein n=1 Tax=Methylomonas sp. TEB TaxID=3398229 RepID=UPI0039F5BE3C